jgi:hypothetical protein
MKAKIPPKHLLIALNACLLLGTFFIPVDGGKIFLRNICLLLFMLVCCLVYSSVLQMEAKYSSEISAYCSSCLCVAWYILRPCRWKKNIPPKDLLIALHACVLVGIFFDPVDGAKYSSETAVDFQWHT